METGIIGLPKVGKTTFFNLLTAAHEATDRFTHSARANVGVARVPDGRLERLRDLFHPRRYQPATVRYVDIPGIARGGGVESLDLGRLREVDALAHVLRAFDDPELPHPEGALDPGRDAEILDLELILADHDLVSKRVDRLDKGQRRGLSPEEVRERELLAGTILPTLEAERPLRTLALPPEDEKRLRGFQLLSAKPMLLVVNVDEARIGAASPDALGVTPGPGATALVVSAPIEEEISRLGAADQQAFLADLGLAEPGLDRVVQASYGLLGLISFFTVGEDEVRAWTIRRGTHAREAAGAIHSDIERGFIRAEVVRWDDLLTFRTFAACREHGKLKLEGKDYVVEDGDVVHYRFNV